MTSRSTSSLAGRMKVTCAPGISSPHARAKRGGFAYANSIVYELRSSETKPLIPFELNASLHCVPKNSHSPLRSNSSYITINKPNYSTPSLPPKRPPPRLQHLQRDSRNGRLLNHTYQLSPPLPFTFSTLEDRPHAVSPEQAR